MGKQLDVPQGQFTLKRIPCRKNEQLRAWDAADEYLLSYLFENDILLSSSKVLILNDNFGALAVVLNKYSPTSISDSFLSQQATRQNLEINNLSCDQVQFRNSLDWPVDKVDIILIKVPKTLAFLEDQLIRMQGLLLENTVVIAAGMVKTMPATVWKLMHRYLGETKPSLARKKARLIFTSLSIKTDLFKNPYPSYYQLENTVYRIANHANVFSRDSLDIGTRFLLSHLPENLKLSTIVDLGSGNGIVGLMLAQEYLLAELCFVDESYMAIASAKENFKAAFPNRKASFFVSDGLTEFDKELVDLIVCNPPFHQQNTIGSQLALSMFKHSCRVLRKGGMLWVVANRHLAYHRNLKDIFGECRVVAFNDKFVIWCAKKI